MEMFDTFIQIFGSGIRLGVPLILACLAGLWSERSGVVDIGLEGKMLTGAFAGAAFALYTGSAWLGLLGGVVTTIGVSLVHGYASIDQRANQIVSGTAINMVADGLTALIGNAIWSQGGRTPEVPETALFNHDQAAVRRQLRRRADPRVDLSPPDLWARPHHLRRLRVRAADLLGALQHTLRPSAACGRRESRGSRYGRHFGARVALQRGDYLRRAGGTFRRLSVARPGRLFPAAHERRQGLHRARRAGIREMAAVAGARDLPVVRLPRRAGDPPAGRRVAAGRRGPGSGDPVAALHL